MMFLATPANGHTLSNGYYRDNDSSGHVSEPVLAGKEVSPYESLNEDVARQLVQIFNH